MITPSKVNRPCPRRRRRRRLCRRLFRRLCLRVLIAPPNYGEPTTRIPATAVAELGARRMPGRRGSAGITHRQSEACALGRRYFLDPGAWDSRQGSSVKRYTDP